MIVLGTPDSSVISMNQSSSPSSDTVAMTLYPNLASTVAAEMTPKVMAMLLYSPERSRMGAPQLLWVMFFVTTREEN